MFLFFLLVKYLSWSSLPLSFLLSISSQLGPRDIGVPYPLPIYCLNTFFLLQCSVKSCIIAFHVTCAFEHGLEMKTILDEGDEVKFKSFCLKHSQNKPKIGEAEYHHHRVAEQSQAKSEKTSLRTQKLRELEEEFYTLVQVEDVAKELGLSALTVDFIYNYWKLKRKSNFNKPLIPPKEDEENGLVQPKEENIHTRMRMFMHLRQDLERVR